MNNSSSNDLKLTYHKAAPDSYEGWETLSLPLGNSGIGASIFGGITRERIQLTEKSLWSGGPSDRRPDYNGGNLPEKGRYGKTLHKIQKLFLSGHSEEAAKQCDELTGLSDEDGSLGYGFFLSYGNMYIDLETIDPDSVTDYERCLDLSSAICSISFKAGETLYTREHFISYPDHVLVTKLSSDRPHGLNLTVTVQPDNEKGNSCCPADPFAYDRSWNTAVKNGCISINGTLSDNGLNFSSHTQVLADGGKLSELPDKVAVKDADSVIILTSVGTDYKNSYPHYRTGETAIHLSARVYSYVANAVSLVTSGSYDTLKQRHLEDYRSLFCRVSLELSPKSSQKNACVAPRKTTDELLSSYRNKTASEDEQRYLESLLFQYGRYLTIASSRETPLYDPLRETLPSNLQGIWAGANNSIWHADYHLNVNLQMNYWPVYCTDLAECAKPLIKYTDSLREPGRVTAAIYTGITSTKEHPANGFMAHTQNTPYGWTCPGWIFDWGWSPAAVPWLLQNCWEYYEYTGDLEYLRQSIYPMMREEAIFYDQLLIEDSDGRLLSAPCFSPEHGPRTAGNTYEQVLIWQLYTDAIQAAQLLHTDEELIEIWKDHRSRLKGPVEIGADGQIKEWYEESHVNVLGQGFGHRHLSHLLGVYPGDLISCETPEFFEAAKVSMNCRTDESTGWGMGQRINTWARLRDGNRAHKLITALLKNGITANLWDTHPPFQIDGNFALTSGISEMLLQSNHGCIDLLPALPDTWQNGHVKGLVARGNFHISIDWADGHLRNATIFSGNGNEAVLRVPDGASLTVTDENGHRLAVRQISSCRISFQTRADRTYHCRFGA